MNSPRLSTGLCSVTFRKLSVQEILALAKHASLDVLEWGGDVHAPPTLSAAELREIGARTRDAGLQVSSYGAYFRMGETPEDAIGPVLDAAGHLGTPVVRIWATRTPSATATPEDWKRARDLARRLADRAKAAGMTLATEFHRGFLTDTAVSAARLARETDHPNFRSFYQVYLETGCDLLAELEQMLPFLVHVHVYHLAGAERRPLAEGAALWMPLLKRLAEDSRPRALLLEFVRKDAPEQLVADAATLRAWVAAAAQEASPSAPAPSDVVRRRFSEKDARREG
ncbi:MAG: sugar phosphate isomerase/epimerase [Verrucomicrobiae bacterium]|nr:sugar phosphate isomerase/epimerase [Verrucomicrobiae bacterium]